MNYCSKCGQEARECDQYCPACGTALKNRPAAVEEEARIHILLCVASALMPAFGIIYGILKQREDEQRGVTYLTIGASTGALAFLAALFAGIYI